MKMFFIGVFTGLFLIVNGYLLSLAAPYIHSGGSAALNAVQSGGTAALESIQAGEKAVTKWLNAPPAMGKLATKLYEHLEQEEAWHGSGEFLHHCYLPIKVSANPFATYVWVDEKECNCLISDAEMKFLRGRIERIQNMKKVRDKERLVEEVLQRVE